MAAPPAVPASNFKPLRGKLRHAAEPNTPLAVPEITYLHHRLLGALMLRQQ